MWRCSLSSRSPVLVLGRISRTEALVRVVVLQTLAANLGSMATPVGNPQNLFLCSYYTLSFRSFLSVVLPLATASLLALSAAALATPGETIEIAFPRRESITQPRLFVLLCLLFVLCLLSVVHVLHYGILTGIVLLCLLLFARGLFAQVDYALLATFVCFFIFAGNMGRIEPVRGALELLMGHSSYWTSLAASQVISNVPAAVLLSGFTGNWQALLAGERRRAGYADRLACQPDLAQAVLTRRGRLAAALSGRAPPPTSPDWRCSPPCRPARPDRMKTARAGKFPHCLSFSAFFLYNRT